MLWAYGSQLQKYAVSIERMAKTIMGISSPWMGTFATFMGTHRIGIRRLQRSNACHNRPKYRISQQRYNYCQTPHASQKSHYFAILSHPRLQGYLRANKKAPGLHRPDAFLKEPTFNGYPAKRVENLYQTSHLIDNPIRCISQWFW